MTVSSKLDLSKGLFEFPADGHIGPEVVFYASLR
jgi:hypothetical protein